MGAGVPLFVVGAVRERLASLVETAAAAFAYAIVVECFVTRDLACAASCPRVLVKSSRARGLGADPAERAMGITSYIVDAQIPDTLVAWVQAHIESRSCSCSRSTGCCSSSAA